MAHKFLGIGGELFDHVHGLELVFSLLVSGSIVATAYDLDRLFRVELDSVIFLDVVDILPISDRA